MLKGLLPKGGCEKTMGRAPNRALGNDGLLMMVGPRCAGKTGKLLVICQTIIFPVVFLVKCTYARSSKET